MFHHHFQQLVRVVLPVSASTAYGVACEPLDSPWDAETNWRDSEKSNPQHLLLVIGSQYDTFPINSDLHISPSSPCLPIYMESTAVIATSIDRASDALPLKRDREGAANAEK